MSKEKDAVKEFKKCKNCVEAVLKVYKDKVVEETVKKLQEILSSEV